MATTCTEDGHKQTTKTSTTISTKRMKKHRTTDEEMEGTNFILRIREQETCLTLQEHDDDDDDDDDDLYMFREACCSSSVHTATDICHAFMLTGY